MLSFFLRLVTVVPLLSRPLVVSSSPLSSLFDHMNARDLHRLRGEKTKFLRVCSRASVDLNPIPPRSEPVPIRASENSSFVNAVRSETSSLRTALHGSIHTLFFFPPFFPFSRHFFFPAFLLPFGALSFGVVFPCFYFRFRKPG